MRGASPSAITMCQISRRMYNATFMTHTDRVCDIFAASLSRCSADCGLACWVLCTTRSTRPKSANSKVPDRYRPVGRGVVRRAGHRTSPSLSTRAYGPITLSSPSASNRGSTGSVLALHSASQLGLTRPRRESRSGRYDALLPTGCVPAQRDGARCGRHRGPVHRRLSRRG